MMIDVTLLKDEIEDQLKNSISIRDLDQKFLYIDYGADLFYTEKKTDSLYGIYDIDHQILEKLSIKDFCIKSKENSNILISLGCGNSHTEKIVFDYLNTIHSCNVEYIGVDYSEAMLKMSSNILSNLHLNKKLLCADFFSKDFKSQISQSTKNYKNKIYTMFSNIFGNLISTKAISMLNNVLLPGDVLWLDVRLKKGNTVGDDLKLFNHYCEYLTSSAQIDFFSNIFWNLGVAKDDFYLDLSTFHDPVLGAIRFDFSAKFTKKVKIKIANDTFIILPKESIKIVHIYAYDYCMLVEFFQEHGFQLQKMIQEDGRGHFVFIKS